MQIRFLILALFFSFQSFADDSLSYTGRLVNTNGSPVTGPVNLKIELAYTDPGAPGVTAPHCTTNMNGVPLSNGVFHLKIKFDTGTNECGLAGKTLTQVLAEAPAGETVAIRVTDLTPTPDKVYSYQAIHSLPYSVIAKNLSQLGAASGEVLSWDGTKWAPAAAGVGSAVTSVATGAGLTGGPITTTGTISIVDGGVTAAKLHQMGAAATNVLKWNGAAWAPAADTGIITETDPTVQGFAKVAPAVCLNNQTLKFDALLNTGAGGVFCQTIAIGSDAVTEGVTNLYFTSARAKTATVADAITNGVTDVAPSQNAVFDALAADVARTKIATGTADHVLINDGAGVMSSVATLPASKGGIGLTSSAAYKMLTTDATGAYQQVSCAPGEVLVFNGAAALTCMTPTTSANAYVQNGNNFGAAAVLGTNSAHSLSFETNSATQMTILSSGNVGIGTIDPKGVLDIASTSSGVLIPRMTTIQRDAIVVVPAPTGMQIYNTTTNALNFYDGDSWEPLVSGTPGGIASINLGTGLTPAGAFTSGGTIAIANSGVDTTQLADNAVTNIKVAAAAAIARTKLASGTANRILINDGSGVMSEVTTVPLTMGGTGLTSATPGANLVLGVNNANTASEYKAIAQGTGVSVAHTANTITVGVATGGIDTTQLADNAVTNIKVAAAAAIARTKLASGTADHVLINDGSGVMSSVATLPVTKGGLGLNSSAAYKMLTTDATGAYQQVSCSPGEILSFNGAAALTCIAPASGIASIIIGTGLTPAGAFASGGTIAIANSGVNTTQLADNAVTNLKVAAAAAIARTKLASGTANRILTNDGSGVMSEVASVPLTMGGTGLTSATPGANLVLGVNNANTASEYKSIAQGTGVSVGHTANTITVGVATGGIDTTQLADNAVTNLKVAAAAAIARTKLANGTADHVLINDGSGVMSSVATLPVTKGGLGLSSSTAYKMLTTDATGAYQQVNCSAGEILMFNGAANLACIVPGTSANAFFQNGNNFGAAAVLGTNGAHSLSFETNNVTHMTILSDGNVGVGTTSPTAKVSIAPSSTSSGAITMTAANGSTSFTTSGSTTLNVGDYIIPTTTPTQGRSVWSGGTGTAFSMGTPFSAIVPGETFTVYPAALNVSSGKLLVQGSTGNVGLGTTNPRVKLEISATGAAAWNNVAAVTAGPFSGGLLIRSYNDGAISSNRKSAIQSVDQDFLTTIPSAVPTSLALQPDGGNVGIGTDLPDTKLDINGALSMRNMAAPAVAPAGQGRIYYDTGSNTFKVSQNGVAYANLVGATVADATTGSKGIMQVGTGLSVSSGTVSADFGAAAGKVTQGNDSRLSDSRAPSGAAGGDLTGNYPSPTLGTSGVTIGTYSKVTVDAKGRVTVGASIVAADVPSLDAAKVTTGTFDAARIPAGTDTTKLPLLGGTMAGVIDMGGSTITNLSSPVANTQAATKAYVDASGGGSSAPAYKPVTCYYTNQGYSCDPGFTQMTGLHYTGAGSPNIICCNNQTASGSAATAGTDGAFIMTQTTYNGNLGGIAGANAKCLTELNARNWLGKSSYTLSGSNVKAWICDGTTCNDLLPATTYYYAYAGDVDVGSASFTTDGFGRGPNHATNWATFTAFNTAQYTWTGRNAGATTTWALSPQGNHCNGWTDGAGGYNGRVGYSNGVDHSRWANTVLGCNGLYRLLCYVDP